MRFSAAPIANAVAWLVVAALAAAALVVADRLGFAGLFLLGALVWMICSLASLDQTTPSWGEAIFRASMQPPRTPEERAAARAEAEATQSPLRFCSRCGAALALIGAVGFIWQTWMASPA